MGGPAVVVGLLAGCASGPSHVAPTSGTSAAPPASSTTTLDPRWKLLGDWPDKTALYVDTQSLKAEGRTRGMWLKLIAPDGSASVAQWMLDCTGRRVRTDAVFEYRPDGSPIDKPSEPSPWTSAAPGTLDDELLNLFCPVSG
jgi:hypothetical protein